MDPLPHGVSKLKFYSTALVTVILAILLIYLGITHFALSAAHEKQAVKVIELEGIIASTTIALNTMQEENTKLLSVLTDEQARAANLEEEVEDAKEELEELEELAKLDPELLKKYSKVYFLNEHYTPRRLRDIDTAFWLNPAKPQKILYDIAGDLRRLLREAKEDGIDLRVASAYRSFDEQRSVKNGYSVIYGAGTANQFSAEQGYSEHQLGTAVDFATPQHPNLTISFENTPAFKWLVENAHEFGFVLSYPRGNAYYQYEPWHWRFVGRDLAEDLHDDGKYFYDLDQRTIDEYLGRIFD
jgi:zinc D-Ala-D-Ala carboxypeptidase